MSKDKLWWWIWSWKYDDWWWDKSDIEKRIRNLEERISILEEKIKLTNDEDEIKKIADKWTNLNEELLKLKSPELNLDRIWELVKIERQKKIEEFWLTKKVTTSLSEFNKEIRTIEEGKLKWETILRWKDNIEDWDDILPEFESKFVQLKSDRENMQSNFLDGAFYDIEWYLNEYWNLLYSEEKEILWWNFKKIGELKSFSSPVYDYLRLYQIPNEIIWFLWNNENWLNIDDQDMNELREASNKEKKENWLLSSFDFWVLDLIWLKKLSLEDAERIVGIEGIHTVNLDSLKFIRKDALETIMLTNHIKRVSLKWLKLTGEELKGLSEYILSFHDTKFEEGVIDMNQISLSDAWDWVELSFDEL